MTDSDTTLRAVTGALLGLLTVALCVRFYSRLVLKPCRIHKLEEGLLVLAYVSCFPQPECCSILSPGELLTKDLFVNRYSTFANPSPAWSPTHNSLQASIGPKAST